MNEDAVAIARLEVLVEANIIAISELKEQQNTINRLATSVEVIATEMRGLGTQMVDVKRDISEVKQGQSDLADKMDTKISEVDKRIDKVENIPNLKTSKMVDSIKEKFVWILLSGLTAYALGNVFPFISFR